LHRGLYAGASAMLVQQYGLDVVANNLANVSTVGFKRRKPIGESFPGYLVERREANRGAPWAGPDGVLFNRVLIGGMYTTVVMNETYSVQEMGTMIHTDNPLDVCILQEGHFFKVSDGNGNVFYTRAGSFTLDPEGNLVTQDGFYVLGEGDEPIAVEGQAVEIGENGEVFVDGEAVGALALYSFEDPGRMRQVGKNLWQETPWSGPAVPVEEVSLRSRYLEASNVNAVEEMVAMVEASRAYEAASRMVQLHDESTGRMIDSFGRV